MELVVDCHKYSADYLNNNANLNRGNPEEGRIMKILSYAVLVGMLISVLGCDDAMNKPKTETRTMIIGGVPVHEQDYQLLDKHLSAQDQLKP